MTIPSLPWLQLVDIRPGKKREWVIGGGGNGPFRLDTDCIVSLPVVEPANVYGVYRLEDITNIQDGYEPDGDSLQSAFRDATGTAFFLLPDGGVAENFDFTGYVGDRRRLCLRKKCPATKRVLIMETDEPEFVSMYESMPPRKPWTYRIEERPL